MAETASDSCQRVCALGREPYLAHLLQKQPKFSPRSQAHSSIRSQEREPEKISHRSPQVLGLGAFLFGSRDLRAESSWGSLHLREGGPIRPLIH